MIKTRKGFRCFVFGMILTLAALLNFCGAPTSVADTESYSFVYNYGNAKIWAFITLDYPFFVGPETNSSASATIYLEKLGSNIGVFINRLTFGFEGTQIRKTVSPNVTLNNSLRSWTWNTTFEQEDINQILFPGQIMTRTLNFEFRYDVIDSSGEYWFYRINENIPVAIQSAEQSAETWTSFGTVFLIVSIFGVSCAVIVLWLKIRRYRKATLSTKRKENASY